MTDKRPSVIRAPRSLPIKQECMEIEEDDDQPQDLSIKRAVKRETLSLPTDLSVHGNSSTASAVRTYDVTTDVVTLERRETESPTTSLTPMERISFVLQDVPSTSAPTSPHPNVSSAPTRRRGRPRLPTATFLVATETATRKSFRSGCMPANTANVSKTN